MRWHQNVTVVEFSDLLICREITQQLPVKDYILTKLSPTVWVIKNDKLADFSSLLQKNGFKPRIMEN